MRTPRGLVALLAGVLSACTLLTNLDGLSGGGDSSGGGARDGSTADGLSDAGLDVAALDAAGSAPTVLASVGAISNGTGLTGQSHLLWAEHAGLWILFYIEDKSPTVIRTHLSADFATWTEGPDLALPNPHSGEGRNFAVATTVIANADVFHMAVSLLEGTITRRHYHARATLTDGVLAFGAVTEQGYSKKGGGADVIPDGPAIAVAEDGYVHDFSGFSSVDDGGGGGTGNAWVWRSSIPDIGGAWNATFARTSIEIVPTVVNARAAISLGGSTVLAFWEKGDTEPDPANVHFSRGSAGLWSPEANVFTDGRQNANDWAVLRVAIDDVHAVRRRTNGALEHRRYDGSSWRDGPAIAAEPQSVGSGLALVVGPKGPMLVALADDGSTVRSTSFDGTGWDAWTTLAPAAGKRGWISGTSSKANAAVIWTEAQSSTYVIIGRRLR